MEALLMSLLLWVQSHSNYEVNYDQLPTIRYISLEEMQGIVTQDLRENLGREPEPEELNLRGLYLHKETYVGDQIYSAGILIREDIDVFDLYLGTETLLHELIHLVQDQNNAIAQKGCNRRLESEAYDLGSKYLLERGMAKDHDEYRGRRWMVIMMSRCNTNVPHHN